MNFPFHFDLACWKDFLDFLYREICRLKKKNRLQNDLQIPSFLMFVHLKCFFFFVVFN